MGEKIGNDPKFPLPAGKNASNYFPMMNSRIFQLLILSFFALARPISAAEMVVGNIRVIKVEGKSAEMIEATGIKSPVKEGVFIRQGTKIITGPETRVDLVFENGSSVNISPSSQFSIDEFIQDPFNSEGIDYKSVEQAPTTSVTKIDVLEGEIFFQVAKQKSGSSFDITTPVGTAGIRGTSGFAGSRGFGLATGSASFRTPAGNTVTVGAGTQVNTNGASGPASPAAISAVNVATSEAKASTPSNTFGASPPNLLPQQQNALNAAAAQGGEAISMVASRLATAVPEFAPDIARMAAILSPSEVLAIATRVTEAAPAFAPQIAASVSLAVPTQAPQIAASVAQVIPVEAPRIAAAVAEVVQIVAPQIAAAVAQVVPPEAPRVAAAVAEVVQSIAPQIAAAVSSVVPQQTLDISDAVIKAVPAADAAAVQQAAQQGATQSNQQGGPSAAGPDTRPKPSEITANPPPPQPQPTPQPTPQP
ncbi:MAG: FecR domain-containing protein, partial [Terrimicrobiaceae bacterium]